MPDHDQIYACEAARYDALVSREDYQGNLLRSLKKIRPFEGQDVVELGAGTGRLTRLIAPFARSVYLFDASEHMLEYARARLEALGLNSCRYQVSPNNTVPLPDDVADIAISGWSVCYAVRQYPETWRDEVRQTFSELKRVLRPGGTLFLLETLGTGFETPQAPEHLRPYFAMLEQEFGCHHSWIRTDYTFETHELAESLVRFFFGDELGDRVTRDGLLILPECTGIWWLEV